MNRSDPRELHNASTDPLLAALAEAEYDDEPYTHEQRAAAQEGREAFQRSEFASLEEVRRELLEEDERVPS